MLNDTRKVFAFSIFSILHDEGRKKRIFLWKEKGWWIRRAFETPLRRDIFLCFIIIHRERAKYFVYLTFAIESEKHNGKINGVEMSFWGASSKKHKAHHQRRGENRKFLIIIIEKAWMGGEEETQRGFIYWEREINVHKLTWSENAQMAEPAIELEPVLNTP